ncbi:MAG TPA: myo-inosose-2 dehydratase [Candidatus Xenobia bacterium]|jgi:inosose dehydratase
MKRIKLGIGPIGWANDDLREWGPERQGDDIMREIAQAGYEGSEMSYKYPQDPFDLRDSLEGHGLVLASAYRWTNFIYPERRDEEIAAARKHVDFCADGGAQHVLMAEGSKSLHWDANGSRTHVEPFSADEWKRVCEAFNEMGQYAQSKGLQLSIHPHGGTAIEDGEEIARLLNGTDAALVGYCLDTGHANYGGSDPVALVKKWGKRIRYAHLKDVRPAVLAEVQEKGKTFLEAIQHDVFGTPGQGHLDFQAILDALMGVDYEGWLVIEADQNPATHPALQVATEAHQRLRAWLGQKAPVSPSRSRV